MRLPVVPALSTKDGTSNKNARLTNMLKESKASGDLAVIRPGLVLSDTYSGLGAGLIPFDGRLLTIYDDTVTDGDLWPWPLDADDWASGTTYGYGDAIWYLGAMYFSINGSNTGNTPSSSSTYWKRSYYPDAWSSGTTYAIGDLVEVDGVLYYSLAPSNTGNNPTSTPMWSLTPPGSSRYRGYVSIAGMGGGYPGPQCASRESAAYAAWIMGTVGVSCATKFGGTYVWRTYSRVVYIPGHYTGYPYRIYGNTYVDPSPFNCTVPPGSPAEQDCGWVN